MIGPVRCFVHLHSTVHQFLFCPTGVRSISWSNRSGGATVGCPTRRDHQQRASDSIRGTGTGTEDPYHNTQCHYLHLVKYRHWCYQLIGLTSFNLTGTGI